MAKTGQKQFDQAQSLAKINYYFKDKGATLQFLALTVIFAVLMIVFGQPVVLLNFTEQLSTIHPLVQLTLATTAGLLVLIASRLLLHHLCSRYTFSLTGYIIWIIIELIVIISTLCTILWTTAGCGKLHLAPLAAYFLLGMFFVMAMPYTLSFLTFQLQSTREENNILHLELEKLSPTPTENEDSAHARIINFYNKGNRLVFSIEGKDILYIEAADNYTNIHYLDGAKENTYILHNTLKELEKGLEGTAITRCHRGFMVNLNNVRPLNREGANLQLELNGCSKVIPVTKTYAQQIADRLTTSDENI